jgi:hypothetical protein
MLSFDCKEQIFCHLYEKKVIYLQLKIWRKLADVVGY